MKIYGAYVVDLKKQQNVQNVLVIDIISTVVPEMVGRGRKNI